MTMMSVNGDRVYTEDVAAGVARRGLWHGKSRVVPIVLLSALFVVMGGAGAQAAQAGGDTIVSPRWSATLGSIEKYPSGATVKITEDASIFTFELEGTKYFFTGQGSGHPIPSLKFYDYGSMLNIDINQNQSIQKLIEETKSYKYTIFLSKSGHLTIDFSFLNKNGDELGSQKINRFMRMTSDMDKYFFEHTHKVFGRGSEGYGVGGWKVVSDLVG